MSYASAECSIGLIEGFWLDASELGMTNLHEDAWIDLNTTETHNSARPVALEAHQDKAALLCYSTVFAWPDWEIIETQVMTIHLTMCGDQENYSEAFLQHRRDGLDTTQCQSILHSWREANQLRYRRDEEKGRNLIVDDYSLLTASPVRSLPCSHTVADRTTAEYTRIGQLTGRTVPRSDLANLDVPPFEAGETVIRRLVKPLDDLVLSPGRSYHPESEGSETCDIKCGKALVELRGSRRAVLITEMLWAVTVTGSGSSSPL